MLMSEHMVVDGLVADPNDPIFGRLEKVLRSLSRDGIALEFIGKDETLSHMKWSWADRTTRTALHMWDDYRTQVKYLELVAPDGVTMGKLRDALITALKPPTRASLFAKARKRLDRTNLSRVVFSALNEPDDETIKLVTDALSSDSPYVREAAAYGAGVLGWAALRAPLEQALADEKNDKVSDSLRTSLELMKSGA
jgi:hypothetical protein